MRDHRHLTGKRLLSLSLAVMLAAGCVMPAAAAEPIGDGVTPTFDEAYYATLDYYGNLLDGSVVKSYTLNGAASITDYGTYDAVNNLSDGTAPSVTGGKTVFDFGTEPPQHFYFEGKTTQPYETLPWTISMSYRLNGVPTRAEDLAGKTGMVEIDLNFVPNEAASDYAKHNYTLEAMAVFNQDDILSLKAEGAQVQLVGNLRMVLFLCLPGEEQHFTIEVGAEDFSFGGMTFLMVPATLSQLEQIADISQKKDELEDDYHKLSGSLDDLLSSMNAMTGSLNASASGLDALNQARGTFSAGKGALYDGTDALKGDLSRLAEQLEPVEQQVQALSQLVTDSKATLNELTDITVSLRGQLADMQDALENLENGSDDMKDLVESAADLRTSLSSLRRALDAVSGGSSGGSEEEEETTSSRAMVKKVKAVHKAYEETDLTAFMRQLLVINGAAESDSQAAAMAAGLKQLLDLADMGMEDQIPAEQQANLATARQLRNLYYFAHSGATFQQFCEQLPGVSAEQAKQMNDLWIVYTSGKLEEEQTLSASLVLNDPAPAAESSESDSVGGAAIDLITGGLDSTLESIEGIKKDLTRTMQSIAKPTAALVGDLADLCKQLDDLTDLMDDASDLTTALRQSTQKLQKILDQADELRNLLNDYEPTLQETLKTVGSLSVTASATVKDTVTLIDSAEDLLKRSGSQLDDGTKKTLESLASVLRRTADVMATSGSIQTSKNAMTDIIEDLWNDHTGDVDNLLLMDATAEAESLTDARNGTPQSVQVMIRSQEIKEEEPEEPEDAAQTAGKGTFWSRVAQMLQDFWAAITGLFR